MNKSLLTLALAAIVLTGASIQASAQTAPAKAQAPAGVQAVDLGLPSGIRWASCNVGATAPEGYGNYYAWGETAPKTDYSWATYKHNNGDNSSDNITKYGNNADTLTTLEPEDDAATANWGGDWRMPTDAEWTELREQCTWTWTRQNGVYGYQVTSNINSNSIFLPATGYRYGTRLYYAGTDGRYWSSSLCAGYQNNAWSISFNPKTGRDYYGRNFGFPVRPVQDKQEEEVESAYVPKPFTVAEGKQITFSGGNLQYTQSTQTWAFAEHQYDMLGDANVNGSTLADKIDLFGWSGSTATAKWGIGTSQSHSDYSGDFADWGTNTIGTDAPDTWRTLTKDEWYYLRYSRANADDLVGVARIDLNADGSKYVNGLVLLPDDWTCPAGVTFKSGFFDTNSVQAYADYQTFTLADWQKLEAAGAVFLPASGLRLGSNVRYMQYYGDYWSATPDDSGYALEFNFNSDGAYASNYDRNYGLAVRLVKDKQEEVVEPAYVAKPFTVAEGKRITFSGGNLQYTQSTQAWAFAEHQYDMLGDANVNGSTLADKIDLFGWSGSTATAKWGIGTSQSHSDYSGDFADWGTNTIGTDAPDTWRTLTIDEWQYLFMHTRWTMAKVNGTLGFMLLPADFVASAGLTISILGDGNMSDAYKNFSESDYSANVYTASQFSQLESAGVVFLPCAGFHRGSSVGNVGSVGYYWSATPCDTDRAGYVYFGSWNAFANGWYDCSLGQSVRLVKNYSNVSTDIFHPSAAETAHARKVFRNGQVLIERGGKTYTLTGIEVE